MADFPPSAPPASAAPEQPPGAGNPSGAPLIGSSPMTGPTQNLGEAAQGNQILQMLLEGMAMALLKFGPASPIGMSLNKAIMDLGKHVPPGAASPQGVSNALKAMALKKMQMQPQQSAMAAMSPGGPGGPGGAPAMPPPKPPPGLMGA